MINKMTIHPALRTLRNHIGYKSWMDHWVVWDDHDQAYVGYAPDEDELCRDSDPARFLLLFKEAANEWQEQQER